MKKQEDFRTDLQARSDQLLIWYKSHARDLPWRRDTDPYHIWISEVMLQQTRVAAVIPYYHAFMERLPDICSLAQVSDDELMKLWEGLGYYSRARNLKKAAQQMVECYAGEMPRSYAQILALPGIGPYTAGAIASIAFGLPYPAVDGNVLRIMSRAICYDEDVLKDSSKREIEHLVVGMIPDGNAGMFTQAMMELGATLCGPSGAPDCEACPWKDVCEAHARGVEIQYPKKHSKKARTVLEYTVLILQDANRTAICKRPDQGLLAGMYGFPMLEGILSKEAVLEKVQEMGYNPIRIVEAGNAKHIFTHVEWHMKGYKIQVDELSERPKNSYIFVEHKDAEADYPMPSAFRVFTDMLSIKQGSHRLKSQKGEQI